MGLLLKLSNIPVLHAIPAISRWQEKTIKKNHFLRSALFYKQFVPQGALCFDVGANMGNRVAPLLHIGAQVVAVEPQEKCCAHLQATYGDKIKIVNKGLGAREEVKPFHISDVSTISTFSDEWMTNSRFKDFQWQEVQDIQITTLDNLITQFGAPHFLKIDVEGFELEVLKGLNSPIKYISFEYALPEQTDNVLACLRRLIEISPAIACNYAVDESMKLAMDTWISAEDMISLVQQDAFQATSFGDIYVKATNL